MPDRVQGDPRWPADSLDSQAYANTVTTIDKGPVAPDVGVPVEQEELPDERLYTTSQVTHAIKSRLERQEKKHQAQLLAAAKHAATMALETQKPTSKHPDEWDARYIRSLQANGTFMRELGRWEKRGVTPKSSGYTPKFYKF